MVPHTSSKDCNGQRLTRVISTSGMSADINNATEAAIYLEPQARILRNDAPGAQGTRQGTQHRRVTPRYVKHVTLANSITFRD